MKLPDALRDALEAALSVRDAVRIVASAPIGGGCISPAARIELSGGDRYFVKWATQTTPDRLFAEEARSLETIADAGVVRCPRVHAVASDFLVLEWLEPGVASSADWRALGRELARMHRCSAEAAGWPADNFIGSLPQSNEPCDDWASFWIQRRLEPQLRRAVDGGWLGRREVTDFERLFERLPELLAAADADGMSLVHGDLWSGNAHGLADDGVALIDPAAYYGHREVDLAMSELFGGFPPAFFEAYEAEWPTLEENRSLRRSAYRVYYLLVHVNLFGQGYVARTMAEVRTLL